MAQESKVRRDCCEARPRRLPSGLSDEERGMCQDIVKRPKGTSEKLKRAQILLKADADGPRWPDAKIAEAYDC